MAEAPLNEIDLACVTVIFDTCEEALRQSGLAVFDFDVRQMTVAVNDYDDFVGTAELDWAARVSLKSHLAGSQHSTLSWAFWRLDTISVLPRIECTFVRRGSEKPVLLPLQDATHLSFLLRFFPEVTAFFTMLARFPGRTIDMYRMLCGQDLPQQFLGPFLSQTIPYTQNDLRQGSAIAQRAVSSGMAEASMVLNSFASDGLPRSDHPLAPPSSNNSSTASINNANGMAGNYQSGSGSSSSTSMAPLSMYSTTPSATYSYHLNGRGSSTTALGSVTNSMTLPLGTSYGAPTHNIPSTSSNTMYGSSGPTSSRSQITASSVAGLSGHPMSLNYITSAQNGSGQFGGRIAILDDAMMHGQLGLGGHLDLPGMHRGAIAPGLGVIGPNGTSVANGSLGYQASSTTHIGQHFQTPYSAGGNILGGVHNSIARYQGDAPLVQPVPGAPGQRLSYGQPPAGPVELLGGTAERSSKSKGSGDGSQVRKMSTAGLTKIYPSDSAVGAKKSNVSKSKKGGGNEGGAISHSGSKQPKKAAKRPSRDNSDVDDDISANGIIKSHRPPVGKKAHPFFMSTVEPLHPYSLTIPHMGNGHAIQGSAYRIYGQKDVRGGREDIEIDDYASPSQMRGEDYSTSAIHCTTQGCTRIFTTQAGLRYHLSTFDHGKVRSIVCPVNGCSKTYTTLAGLRYHRKTMHKAPSNTAATIVPIPAGVTILPQM